VFLIVAIMLSVGLLLASSLVAREAVTSAEEQVLRYAELTLRAFLQSTLPNVSYMDVDGQEVVRPPGTTAAGFLIAEDLALRDEGAPAANVENSFSRSVERQFGHAAWRLPMTSVSNVWPHPRQVNSNKGITGS